MADRQREVRWEVRALEDTNCKVKIEGERVDEGQKQSALDRD